MLIINLIVFISALTKHRIQCTEMLHKQKCLAFPEEPELSLLGTNTDLQA